VSKLETSKNIGPHPFYSINGATTPTHSRTQDVGNFTKHSYQVICDNVGASAEISFYIFGKNELTSKWQKVAGYLITSARNNNGILYFDCWNFNFAKCCAIGTFGGATITVIEKHNA
tara:strand:- start:1186 stop:1536 length:351 start_codon:yes stop_codon:yes gene_type:complete